jgi:hypothetical protein
MFARYGAEPGIPYVALLILEEVSHAVVRARMKLSFRPHGRAFRSVLKQMYEQVYLRVLSILMDGAWSIDREARACGSLGELKSPGNDGQW